MPRLLRQRRAEHWTAFMMTMAARHGAGAPSNTDSNLSDGAHVSCAPSPAPVHQSPWTPPPPQHAIDAFGAVIWRAAHQRLRMPTWWRERTYQRFGGQCAYCDRTLAAGPACCLDHVIPPPIGGPDHVNAVVLCCRGCKRAKAGRDLLLWRRELPPHLRAMREQLVQESRNHPVVASQRRATTHEDVLRLRWLQPRFACHFMQIDGGVLIGWAHPIDAPVAAYMSLLYEQDAQPCITSAQVSASPVIFWVPAADVARRVVSSLIELNAWVRPTALVEHLEQEANPGVTSSEPPTGLASESPLCDQHGRDHGLAGTS